jgi:hypothetical protein
MNNELIETINKSLGIDLPDNIDLNDLQKKLNQYINHLIKNDFEKLVMLLYRIDVSEIKLKQLLQQNNKKDASEIISKLIIERQLQKIKTRNQFKQEKNNDGEERW